MFATMLREQKILVNVSQTVDEVVYNGSQKESKFMC